MKRVGLLLLFSFLIFGIVLHAPLVVPEGNNTSSNNDTVNNSVSDDHENETNDDKNETQVDDEEDNACKEISGETFRSLEKHEVGLSASANNTTSRVVGYWNIGFKNARFSWKHSDVIEGGNYSCNGKSITGTTTGGKELTGELNGDSLTWDGVKYVNIDDDHENKTKDRDENKTKFRSKETFTRNGCTIKVERKITVEEGKRVEVVKRKIRCADGTEAEIKIKVENRTEDGRIREKIKYEFKGRQIDVDTGEGIDLEEETNATEYKLRARFEGNVADINIMPDEAVQIILEKLRAALNSTNFTVELREIKDGNVQRVVYNVKTNKHGRFLGVFKLKLKVEGQVDPVTGEFLGTSKPWWAFLVTGEDSDQTQENDVDNGNVNDTEEGDVNNSDNGDLEEVNETTNSTNTTNSSS